MTTTHTLTAFIEQRLADLEASVGGGWPVTDHLVPGVCNACGGPVGNHKTSCPEFVLAQVAALRAVVELHTRRSWQQNSVPAATYIEDRCPGCQHVTDPCPTLRDIATIWSAHEAFEEGWR